MAVVALLALALALALVALLGLVAFLALVLPWLGTLGWRLFGRPPGFGFICPNHASAVAMNKAQTSSSLGSSEVQVTVSPRLLVPGCFDLGRLRLYRLRLRSDCHWHWRWRWHWHSHWRWRWLWHWHCHWHWRRHWHCRGHWHWCGWCWRGAVVLGSPSFIVDFQDGDTKPFLQLVVALDMRVWRWWCWWEWWRWWQWWRWWRWGRRCQPWRRRGLLRLVILIVILLLIHNLR